LIENSLELLEVDVDGRGNAQRGCHSADIIWHSDKMSFYKKGGRERLENALFPDYDFQ
jgi:hypothetical protein